MTEVALADIARCFDGVAPSSIASCSADGEPNVCYVSQLYLVDEEHVAVSNQFLNKTQRNVDENPHLAALVVDPQIGAQYTLHLTLERREVSGTLFDQLAASIESIASLTGMQGIFRLRSADVYRVDRCVQVHHGR
jgi:predicted pyridoxine 5'-phosphate oxidase superfamily flavin-nucleotide-binding protein